MYRIVIHFQHDVCCLGVVSSLLYLLRYTGSAVTENKCIFHSALWSDEERAIP